MSERPFDPEALREYIARKIGEYQDRVGNARICTMDERLTVYTRFPFDVRPTGAISYLTGNASLRLMTLAQQKALLDWLKSPFAQEEARAVMQFLQEVVAK